MSAFKLEYKKLSFTVELSRDLGYAPIERWCILTDEDRELLKSGSMAFFSLVITETEKLAPSEYFIPGVQLPLSAVEQMEDLETILLDDGLLDEIVSHLELMKDKSPTPSWSVNS